MRIVTIAVLAAAFAASQPAMALTETLNASFTQPDGGVSVNSYKGVVTLTLSGVGQSLGDQFNDAFYLINSQTNDGSYYQLTYSPTTLVPFDPAHDAKNALVGPLPAYDPSHVYTFQLDTGLTTPGQLHFGVSDGNFSDNSGAYTITITGSVPEPASWALMLAGFGAVGLAARRRSGPARITA